MVKFLIVLFLSSGFVFSHDAKIHIYGSTNKIIPPEQSGSFIEFLLDYINGPMGMWAQEFEDRGFDIDPNESGINPFWNKYGVEPAATLSSSEMYNPNGVYGIMLFPGGGIYQEIFNSKGLPLDIYFYSKSIATNSKIKVKIYNQEMNQILFESEEFSLTDNWKKYEITSESINSENKINIVFENIGGSLLIDEVSCMPANNILGVRKEYYDLYKFWKPKVIRYPGGWFADIKGTSLRAAIGDIDKRKSPHLAARGINQRMDLGLHELQDFCDLINAEIYYVVNYANGTPQEAAEAVAYANGTGSTGMAQLRRENGRDEPFNIRYWEVGNEQWEAPLEYSQNYNSFYDLMIAEDQSIKVLLPGNHWGGRDFFDKMLMHIDDKFDIWSYHPTIGIRDHDNQALFDQFNVMAAAASRAESYFKRCEGWLNGEGLGSKEHGLTEWWSSYGNDSDWLLDTNRRGASLEAALYNANIRHFFSRKSERIRIGARTAGIGMIRRRLNSNGERVIYGTGGFHALAMTNNHIGNKLMDYFVQTEKYEHIVDGYTYQVGLDRLDAVVTESNDSIFISMINRHISDEANVELNFSDFKLPDTFAMYQMYNDDFLDANTPDNPEVVIAKTSIINAKQNIVLPKHSFTIIALPKGVSSVSTELKNSYPNPAQDRFNLVIENEIKTIENLKLIDTFGRVYNPSYNLNFNELIIDTRKIPDGFYVISAKINNFEVDYKFIKMDN